jgi:ferric iron reductase protein FhuF
LTKLDFNRLEQSFHLMMVEPKDSIYSASVTKLLNVSDMQTFLASYALQIGALDFTAAAAYFIRRLGGVLLAQQYFISVHNTIVDFSLSNLKVYLTDHAKVVFQPQVWREEMGPVDEEKRNRWLLQTHSFMYGEVARPLIQSLSALSHMCVDQLWAQLPAIFRYRLETLSRETCKLEYRKQLEKDFYFLRQKLPPSVFHLTCNPFDHQVQMVPHIEDPNLQDQIKPACCMYYRTESGVYCYTCPHLNDEEREIRRILHRAKRNANC